MSVYYRDPSVSVTSTEYSVDGQRYRLDELTYVWHRRGPPDARARFRRRARWGLLALAAVIAAGYVAKTPLTLRLGAGISQLPMRLMLRLAASMAVVGVGWPLVELVLRGLDHVHVHGVVVREIWARWHGEEVLLLRSSDSLRFGRVYRALQRALEHQTSRHQTNRHAPRLRRAGLSGRAP
ncbi:MAG TPA: DUF6232 family protein [Micromonosporaceae bacterium]|nr:DUF6232 family protein [Micromonosporaceae bacterium]